MTFLGKFYPEAGPESVTTGRLIFRCTDTA
jgi:hypothetical protein